MSKSIRIQHSVGETVFLRTDMEQLPRLITRLTVAQCGVEYQVRHGAHEPTWHQACEIMREPKAKRTPGYK